MTLIRCTTKLRKEMGLKPADLVETAEASGLLGDWYAHLFFYARQKCVLFAAEKTLCCFLAPALTRGRIRKLDEVFRDGLFRLLLDEGFQAGEAQRLFDQCLTVRYGAGADRTMTGSVTELVKMAEAWLDARQSAALDLPKLNHDLNRIPMKRIGYDYAIDQTRIALGQK